MSSGGAPEAMAEAAVTSRLESAVINGGDELEGPGEEAALLLTAAGADGSGSGTDSASAGRRPPQWWRRWRYRVALTAALGEAIVYGQRIAVPIALVVMQAELQWSKETQGVVMTGFWIGYAAMQIPGGWLTTRWGPRRVVGCGLAASSLMHLLMPVAAAVSPQAMAGLRKRCHLLAISVGLCFHGQLGGSLYQERGFAQGTAIGHSRLNRAQVCCRGFRRASWFQGTRCCGRRGARRRRGAG